jgi:hypothetical protein
VIRSGGVRIEVFLFSADIYLQDFVEIIGADPWWVAHQNVLLHFPETDPDFIGKFLEALSG